MKAVYLLAIAGSAWVLSTVSNPSLQVDTNAVLTASDMDWEKIQIDFDVEPDEVVVFQRKSDFRTAYSVRRAARTSQYILLRREHGGSVRDSIGDVTLGFFNDPLVLWETSMVKGPDSGYFEATTGKTKFRWDFQKMKFDDVLKLVPELQKDADVDGFTFKGNGSILKKKQHFD